MEFSQDFISHDFQYVTEFEFEIGKYEHVLHVDSLKWSEVTKFYGPDFVARIHKVPN